MIAYKGISGACSCFFMLLTGWFSAFAHPDTITLQLKWKHQFQFAGYYAAQLKGFYEAENLYVKFKESSIHVNGANELLRNNANYAVTGSDALLDYQSNKSIVALAAIYQHCPYVIISKKEDKITKPTDLAGKTVSAPKGQGLILLKALLKSEGIPLDSVKIISPDRNPPLIDGGVDAVIAYSLDKPARLKTLGVETAVIDPSDYGIDFYGDILITSTNEIEDHPERVRKFLAATLKGWNYALRNPDELCDHILTLPGVTEGGLNKALLLNEARQVNELVMPMLVEIGHMNKGRWENILRIYKEEGLVSKPREIDSFLYHPEAESTKYIRQLGIMSIFLLLCAVVFFIRSIFTKHHLKKEQEKLVQADIKRKTDDDIINTIIDHAGIILWNWNVSNSDFTAYGHDNKGFGKEDLNNIEDLKSLIHPDTSGNFDLFLILLPDNFCEEVLIKINGNYEWYLLTAKAKDWDEDKNAISFMGLLTDISRLKAKEENLDKLSYELNKTNSELQKFAYITSHNLRAPVVNLGSLIEFYDFSAKDQSNNNEIVQKMYTSVIQLKTTLDDLIFVVSGRAEAAEFQVINIHAEMQDVVSDLKPGSSVNIEYDFARISQIEYPVKQFRSIFSCLISNSLKYKNPEKPLFINLRSYDADEYIAIEIADNGLGIDIDKNKDKIFRLYQRFHPHIEGRGIGLFITKSQIESLDGKIEVKSKMELGTTFTVFFRKRLLK